MGPDSSVASTAYSEEFESNQPSASDEIPEDEEVVSAPPSDEIAEMVSAPPSSGGDSGPLKVARAPPSGSYSSEVFEEEAPRSEAESRDSGRLTAAKGGSDVSEGEDDEDDEEPNVRIVTD